MGTVPCQASLRMSKLTIDMDAMKRLSRILGVIIGAVSELAADEEPFSERPA